MGYAIKEEDGGRQRDGERMREKKERQGEGRIKELRSGVREKVFYVQYFLSSLLPTGEGFFSSFSYFLEQKKK